MPRDLIRHISERPAFQRRFVILEAFEGWLAQQQLDQHQRRYRGEDG
jgi:hypothetical protein